MFTIRSWIRNLLEENTRRFSVCLQAAFRSSVYTYIPHTCRIAEWYDTTHNGACIRFAHIPHLGILCPLAVIDSPGLPTAVFPLVSRSDNAAKIILATRHATCQCNFAAISNFLGSLTSPFCRHPPHPLLFVEEKCEEDVNSEQNERRVKKRREWEERESHRKKENARVKLRILCQRTSLQIRFY